MSMVLYSRTTRWRGPYYQFCLAKLLILFFTSSQLFSNDVFFSFIQHQQQKINHSEKTITHKHTLSLHWCCCFGPWMLVLIFGSSRRYILKNGGLLMVKRGFSSSKFLVLPPESAVLPRQTFLTHCVLHCAVTDSLARGCSWNHGRNTAKCSVVCVYSTRARRAFSCRPGRSVYTIVLVVPWCCSGWHYIVIV